MVLVDAEQGGPAVTLTEDDLKLLEQQIRTVIRAEIVSAFGKLAASAGWYTSGFGELTESAAHMLKDAVEMATRELIPAEPEPEPESCTQHEYRYFGPHSGSRCVSCNKPMLGQTEPVPVNPFAPKRTADQWAVILRSTIDAAEKDGHEVWIKNDCCGCHRMTLEVGAYTEHVRVIGDSE
jgi:hypothetical protein